MATYFIIGIIYALINGWYRKLNEDGDWLLTLVWMFLWPICILGLLFAIKEDLIYKKRCKNE